MNTTIENIECNVNDFESWCNLLASIINKLCEKDIFSTEYAPGKKYCGMFVDGVLVSYNNREVTVVSDEPGQLIVITRRAGIGQEVIEILKNEIFDL